MDPFQKILDAAIASVTSEVHYRNRSWKVDSEIERVFATALQVSVSYVRPYVYNSISWIEAEPPLSAARMHEMFVQTQAQIGAYRVDFLIYAYDFNADDLDDKGEYNYRDDRWKRIVIECDGHDFHERTKEQAARDKARDRALVQAKCTVLRFTGSELWRDPIGCAIQVIEVVDG